MDLLEKDLENMIYVAAQTADGKRFLNQRGLCISGKPYRQFRLGEYGIADLITSTLFKNEKGLWVCGIHVYELKRGEINYATLSQAARYKTAIEQHFVPTLPDYLRELTYVQISLIGSHVDTSLDFPFLINHLPGVGVYSYNYSYRGLIFINHHSSGAHVKKGHQPITAGVTRADIREMMTTQAELSTLTAINNLSRK